MAPSLPVQCQAVDGEVETVARPPRLASVSMRRIEKSMVEGDLRKIGRASCRERVLR